MMAPKAKYVGGGHCTVAYIYTNLSSLHSGIHSSKLKNDYKQKRRKINKAKRCPIDASSLDVKKHEET